MRQKPEDGIHDGVDGESNTTLRIQFTNGNLLTGETAVTTVSAKVLKGEEDITSEYAASAFVWARDMGNAEADAAWNAAHNGMKEFTVSASDLTDDMKLTCTLTGTSPDYGSVYVDENMNLIHAPAEADANDTLHLENCILSVETSGNEYELNGNVLSVVRHRLNGSVTAEAWVYTAAPEKLVEFEYDSSGLRTQKKVTDHGETVTTDYIYNGKKLVELTCGEDTLHFFYDAQGRPTKANFNGTVCVYVHNLQGDVVGVLDKNGRPAVTYCYDVWGVPVAQSSNLVVAFNSLIKLNPFRYRGYIWDSELDLYFLRKRYYNPVLKRFENADEVLGEVGKQFGHNLFAYCRNHTVRRKDADGREDVDVYEEFCSIFVNTYDVDFETYIQMPSVTGFLEMTHETRNYELLSVSKEIYVEKDMDRFAEDTATFSNIMGLMPPFSLSDALSFALDLMVSTSESSSRYSLGDIEREAYTVEYRKRDQFTYTDAYGVSIVLKVDYKIKETYRIGAGTRNGAAYFDGRNIGMTIVDRDWEIWENGVKIKK